MCLLKTETDILFRFKVHTSYTYFVESVPMLCYYNFSL